MRREGHPKLVQVANEANSIDGLFGHKSNDLWTGLRPDIRQFGQGGKGSVATNCKLIDPAPFQGRDSNVNVNEHATPEV